MSFSAPSVELVNWSNFPTKLSVPLCLLTSTCFLTHPIPGPWSPYVTEAGQPSGLTVCISQSLGRELIVSPLRGIPLLLLVLTPPHSPGGFFLLLPPLLTLLGWFILSFPEMLERRCLSSGTLSSSSFPPRPLEIFFNGRHSPVSSLYLSPEL